MKHDSRFKRLITVHNEKSSEPTRSDDSALNTVRFYLNGMEAFANASDSVAAAVLLASAEATRYTANQGSARAPYCMMGVCFECLLCIDGVPNQQACMIKIKQDMHIETQTGLRGDVAQETTS